MEDNSVLTTQEVADMLKIAKNTVYELIKRGELNSYKVGKKVRIDLKDVIEYKNRTKTIPAAGATNDNKSIPIRTKIHAEADLQNYFVICGQDILLDILARYLQYHSNGIQTLRSYVGSYNGLYALYHDEVKATSVHLWDSDTNEYNIPFVKRMLPGVPAVVLHLATRLQGFYVAKGNPKGIKGWEDLKRKDISVINREKGSGTRILLDEHLKRLGINTKGIAGYYRESTSHLAIASTVARGGADIGLGNEKTALQVNDVDFIPLQTEQLDLVIKKENMDSPEVQALIKILNMNEFQLELQGIGGYNIENMGKIIAQI
jgi:putative molybdopterin biosynthesis protein